MRNKSVPPRICTSTKEYKLTTFSVVSARACPRADFMGGTLAGELFSPRTLTEVLTPCQERLH
jgi:hypothetical protein